MRTAHAPQGLTALGNVVSVKNLLALFFLLVPVQYSFAKTVQLHPSLQLLAGNWQLSESKLGGSIPDIKLNAEITKDNRGLVISLYEKNSRDTWEVVMVEYLVYDYSANKIHVLLNSHGNIGKGIGSYNAERQELSFVDTNMQGEKTLAVTFSFIDKNQYVLTGRNPDGDVIWSFVYKRIA